MTATAIADAHPEFASLAERLTDEDATRADMAVPLLEIANVLVEQAARLAGPLASAQDLDLEERYVSGDTISDEAVFVLLNDTTYGRVSDLAFHMRQKLERFE